MDQSYTDLLAAVAKQAMKAAGFHRQGIMPAARWLKQAGLMTETANAHARAWAERKNRTEKGR
jgi:hypothetical protein